MAAQLAAQTELKSLDGNVLTLALPAAHKHLADKVYADKLKAALDQATGRKWMLAFEVGSAADASLAAQKRRAQAEEKSRAEAAFRGEPFVQDVLSRFDAKIRPDSIKPRVLNAATQALRAQPPIEEDDPMMKNQLAGLMKQAQQMQDNMKKAQEELARIEVEGQSGAGIVKVVMTCRHDVKRVTIDPSLLGEDKDMLEDLLAAAINDAVRRVETTTQEKMAGLTTGMPMPPASSCRFDASRGARIRR